MTVTDFIPEGVLDNMSTIKIIGVGGGGCNAVTRLYNEGIKDVEYLICNTDRQALMASPVPDKIQLGSALTKGFGAGMNPEKGRNAALESIEHIKKYIGGNIDVVFITAGMGGGTGTGAAPVIAKAAKEAGLLTIAVVTYPTNNEGLECLQRAYHGIEEMSKYTDSIIIVDNQKMYDFYGDLSIQDAYKKADDILDTAVRGISEIITSTGFVNVDLEDVKVVMRDSGMALVGTGRASGEDRAREAVEKALTSPLLKDFDLNTAKNVLVNIMYNSKSSLLASEDTMILDLIRESTGGGVSKQKRGLTTDNRLEEGEIAVTILATGFKVNNTPPARTRSYSNSDTVELTDGTADGRGTITLSTGITGEFQEGSIRELDTENIFTYGADCNISDLENETALARRERLRKAGKI